MSTKTTRVTINETQTTTTTIGLEGTTVTTDIHREEQRTGDVPLADPLAEMLRRIARDARRARAPRGN